MKALTVRQPWAWAIISGAKTVENRTRRTHHRGRIAIHVAKRPDPDAIWDQEAIPANFGNVIGTVEIVGCHHADDCARHLTRKEGPYTEHCSPFANPDAWHWELAGARPVTPFPATGKLGLWQIDMEETPS
ncbi:ASCH domain-containing protein [Zhihengliuella halotolerans]|uniref:ASCH domain-containing protein n=1 Tax=Zhihengliuella halotolerans TaxID=370736 RepID=UPI000C80BBB4|nr:ASCH domain-containing protein [Zhihengliuella halotolerans]